MEVSKGQLLAGKYRVERVLGQGRMGEVPPGTAKLAQQSSRRFNLRYWLHVFNRRDVRIATFQRTDWVLKSELHGSNHADGDRK